MQPLTDYLAMDGYAWFVWPAYALSALGLVGLLLFSLRRNRRLEARLAANRADDGQAEMGAEAPEPAAREALS